MAQSGAKPDDSATRARIKTHMNTSHRDSLSLFLQHYCDVPSSSTTPASTTLDTVTLNSLIIFSQGKRYYIPLHPPMSSFSEVRPRMKAMHNESLRGLKISDVKITTYVPPQGLLQKSTFVVVLLTMFSFSRSANFVPGALFYETFGLGYVPNFAWFCRTIQPWLITFMVMIHAAEASYMASTRLQRHRVRRWSRLWWMWMGSCFIEGFGSFQRIDRMIKEKEKEMEMERKELN